MPAWEQGRRLSEILTGTVHLISLRREDLGRSTSSSARGMEHFKRKAPTAWDPRQSLEWAISIAMGDRTSPRWGLGLIKYLCCWQRRPHQFRQASRLRAGLRI